MFLPIAVGAAAVGLMLRSPRNEVRIPSGTPLVVNFVGSYLPKGTVVSTNGRCPPGYRIVGSIDVLGADGISYRSSLCGPIQFQQRRFR